MAKPLPFELYPFYEYDTEHLEIQEHVEADRLPADTLFRLAGIGYNEMDPQDNEMRLREALLEDIVEHADNWGKMRPESQKLLDEPRPDAIIAIDSWKTDAYSLLDPMYYSITDLARSVREYRAERGVTATQTPHNFWYGVQKYEESLCRGLALPVWRAIVTRVRPHWLEEPEKYYRTFTPTYTTPHYFAVRTMRKLIVQHAVISDPLVMGIHEETERTGVKGIGPGGKEALRRMLEEEHWELNKEIAVEPAGPSRHMSQD